MQFKINNLEYAWVGNAIKHIDSANKEDSYYLDEGLTIPLVYCNGTVVKSYWRKESNIDESIIRNFFGSSESVEHYNKKIQLSKSLVLNNVSIDDEIQDYVILGSSSIVEYRAKEINKIIDLVYLDNNGDVLVGIEIFCTNKKTSKDIEKFNKLKFPVYEYDINKGVCYPISAPNTNTDEQRRIYSEINEIERKLSGVRIRIERGREYVCEQQERIKLENKKYWEETNRIEELRDWARPFSKGEESERIEEIRKINQEINDIKEKFKWCEDEIRDCEKFTSEAKSAEPRIKVEIEEAEREELEIKGRFIE
jgi:hypothetical protein